MNYQKLNEVTVDSAQRVNKIIDEFKKFSDGEDDDFVYDYIDNFYGQLSRGDLVFIIQFLINGGFSSAVK